MKQFSLSTRVPVENSANNQTCYPKEKLHTTHSRIEAGYAVRTNALTYASYFGDGSGRDTYVVQDNGGLANHQKNHMQIRRNRVHTNTHIPVPRKDPPAANYHCDGTGRDSYVKAHHGGLINDYKCPPSMGQFQSTLRDHQILPAPASSHNTGSNTIDLSTYQNWYTPREKGQFAVKATDQMKLTSRLSPVQRKSWKVHRIEGESANSPARQLQKAHNQLHINNCTQKDKIEARNASMFTDYQKNTYISPIKSTRAMTKQKFNDFNQTTGSIMDRHRSVALNVARASNNQTVDVDGSPSDVMSGTINLRQRAFSPDMNSLMDYAGGAADAPLARQFGVKNGLQIKSGRKGHSMMAERGNAGSTLTKPLVLPRLDDEQDRAVTGGEMRTVEY